MSTLQTIDEKTGGMVAQARLSFGYSDTVAPGRFERAVETP